MSGVEMSESSAPMPESSDQPKAEIVLVVDPDVRWSDLVVLRGHFDNTRYAKLTVSNALFDDGPALAATVQRLYREAMDAERPRSREGRLP